MIVCQFETGKKTHLRHCVVDALAVKGNKILVVKRAEWLVEGGKYALPGGYIDTDEVIHEAVMREVREETGWKAKVTELFCITDNPHRRNDDKQNIAFVFLVKPVKEVQKTDDETLDVAWFDLNDTARLSRLAFDHAEIVVLYKDYLKNPRRLPFFKSSTNALK